MKSAGDSTALDLLLAHGDWVRRMACTLTRDEAAADDLAQETFRTALERPPRKQRGLRGWLAVVTRNRWRNVIRGRRRRAARENEAVALEARWAPSPEEVIEQLALKKTVAELVAALPEAERQVVYLRYFEGCDSPEIARRLGCPEGTVRWRLKRAIDKIRLQLDGAYGDRRRWAILLVPFAVDTGPPERRGSGRPWVLGAGVLAGAAILVAVLLPRQHQPGPAADRAPSTPSSRLQPAWLRPPSLVPASPVADRCEALAELRHELALRTREVATHGRSEHAFAVSPPNPVAEKTIGALLADAFARAGRCDHALVCRGLVCRLETLVPGGEPLAGCWRAAREARWSDRLYAGDVKTWGGVTAHHDPVAGKAFLRQVDFYRLASESGEPVPPAAQRALPPLTPGRHRPLPLPAGLSEPCLAEGSRLQAAIRWMWTAIDQSRLPDGDQRFASSVRDPGLEAEVSREVARMTGLSDGGASVDVECRGPKCIIRRVGGAAVDGRGVHELARRNKEYFILLERATAATTPDGPSGATNSSLFVYVWSEEERRRPLAGALRCRFAEAARAAGVLSRCERAHRPRGSMQIVLALPDPPEITPGPWLRIDALDEAGASAFGRCVVDHLREIASGFEVPPLRDGGIGHYKIVSPGATSILGDDAAHCRRYREDPR